jgi:hypothetical protein
MIGPQIAFNIEKLINTICKSIGNIYLNKYTDTYPHNMCTKEFIIIHTQLNLFIVIQKIIFFSKYKHTL